MNKKTIFGLCAAGLLFVSGMTLSGCGTSSGPGLLTQETPLSRSDFLLNTFVTITLYDSDDSSILDDSMALCKEYENIFSKTLETSELYKINHRTSDTVTVSDDMAALLAKGLEYCEKSDGAFDITIEPLSSLWNFTSGEAVIPDKTIDLGSIAKGYIADRIKEQLLDAGVKSAIINLGGNVLCVGEKPDGSKFNIGLQKPFADRDETFEVLGIKDLSVVTSGVYERHFEIDGKNYHHILNPATGYPYDNGLISVTILSAESVDGDGLSTTCFSLGLEKGLELANSLDGIYACFIDEDYNVYYSDGMEDFIIKQ